MTEAPALLADPPLVTVPSVTWPEGRGASPVAMACPNCGSASPKPPVLTVSWITPDHPRRETHVLRCPACTARFYDDQNPPDYTEPSLLERGRVPFYLQQGAGISLITSPLAQIRKPAGSTYLEVGCGFGFGLDFAGHARGWHGKGIDPAPLSGLGRQLLGLDIELRYLDQRDADAPVHDVIMASETIEHVPSPAAFLRILAAALKPDGILVLTTPDASRLVPATPPGSLVPLLSPGLHLVFQTERSLRDLLGRSGFHHVVARRDAYSLVVFASRTPFALDRDQAAIGAVYRGYLERRARDPRTDTDLFLGFAGRAFQEAVNAADWAAARRAWDLLLPVCAERFRLNLESATVPDGALALGLDGMARLMPLNLAGLFHGRAMLGLAGGATRTEVAPWFAAGEAAASLLRRALHAIAMDDLMTEQLEWLCRAELCLCAASSRAADVGECLAALPPAPTGDGEEERRAIVLRALVALVNAGAYERGEELAAVAGLRDASFADPFAIGPATEAERDALFSLAILDARPGGDPARARARFARLRGLMHHANGGDRSPLFWQALRGELQAADQMGDRDAADRLLDEARTSGDVAGLPADLADRQLSRARQRFVGLVNADDYQEARVGRYSRGFAARSAANRLNGLALLVRHAFRRSHRVLWYRLVPSLAWGVGFVRGNRQTVHEWPSEPPALGPRVAVFGHFDRAGLVRPHVMHFVASLRQAGLSVVFVSNSGRLKPESFARLQELCASILVRRNIGYDFGAWREALDRAGLPRPDTEMVILANDSVYGPLTPLDGLLSRLDFTQADIWGLTDSWQSRYHLQSFFLAAGAHVLASEAWRRFWRDVRPVPSKHWIIERHEVGFTQQMLRAGFRCQAVWQYADLVARVDPELLMEDPTAEGPKSLDPILDVRRHHARRIRATAVAREPMNPTSDLWRQLLECGFPFIKRELLRDNPTHVADIADWRDAVRQHLDADPTMIDLDLRRALRNKAP